MIKGISSKNYRIEIIPVGKIEEVFNRLFGLSARFEQTAGYAMRMWSDVGKSSVCATALSTTWTRASIV